MKIRKVDVTRFETTPKKLRAIADQLERLFEAATVGDDIPKVVSSSFDMTAEIWFVADQEAMWRKE
jgi:hypothetical protein